MSSAPRRCLVAVGVVEGFTHGRLRNMGNVFSLRSQPRAPRGARRSRIRRDVHQCPKHSRPGFAGANRRRPNVGRGHCALDVGSNCPPGSCLVAACPRFHATVPASTKPPVFSSMKVVLPGGAARRRVSSMETRGPRCRNSARGAPKGSSVGRLRWAGGGSHRLAAPGREQLCSHWRASWE